MASTVLRGEERIGLIVAAAAHVALLVLLVVRPPGGESVIPPQRIEVTLTDEVGLTSTSPEPFEDAAPDVAPQLVALAGIGLSVFGMAAMVMARRLR